MDIPCLIFGVIFLICGAIFGIGKFHVFIPSWKNMSQKEKNKIPVDALGRNVGILISLCGLIFFISGIFTKFRTGLFLPLMIIWIVVAGFDVFYISKSKRYNF